MLLDITSPSGVDTSPGSGFEKFGKTFRKPQTTQAQAHKDKINTDLDITLEIKVNPPEDEEMGGPILTYSPPSFTQIYDGSTSIKKFFTKFEAYASTFSWDADMRLTQLLFYLTKAALKCYEQLRRTQGDKFTYDSCKKEMCKYFASKSSPQEYDKLLRERQLMDSENIEQYFWDVIDLVHKVDSNADFANQRDHVLKGLPQDVAKDIWNSQSDSLETLQAAILKRQKFESLMGKKAYSSQEQAINQVCNQLENMGFSITKREENKQEVNFAYNKNQNKKGQKGKAFKPNSQGPQSGPMSSQSQYHPRGAFQNNNNNRRGKWPSQNQNNNNNSWSQKGHNEDYSRRDQYPNNRGFGRQGQRYNNNYRRYSPRDNFVNFYEHYGPPEAYENQMVPEAEAMPMRYEQAAMPYNNHSVNTFQENEYW